MKKIIKNTFIMLLFFVNIAYLPQAIIAIINKVPLISSINYSYEYISLGLKNDFPLIRYSKDILVVLLFLFMFLDTIKTKKINKIYFVFLISILLFLMPLSIYSLMFSDEFSLFMIIAGIRVIIFPTTIILFVLTYLDNELINTIYNIIINLLKLIFIITVFQSLIIIIKYGTINIARYRLMGTFASSGLLGLFGVGVMSFIIIYKININNNIHITPNSILIAFIIYASGTRTAMILYSILLFSYFYYIRINKNKSFKLTNLFIFFSVILAFITLKLAESVAERGSAIAVQFQGGRATFIIEYLMESNLKEILFGKGIGFGTNTALSMLSEVAVNLDSSTSVMDGTINILITQFGLIITIIICLLYLYIVKKISNTSIPSEIKISFIVTNIIILVIGNVLEQFSFQLLFIINHILTTKKFKEYNNYSKKTVYIK